MAATPGNGPPLQPHARDAFRLFSGNKNQFTLKNIQKRKTMNRSASDRHEWRAT
jgi:hypothetical protein